MFAGGLPSQSRPQHPLTNTRQHAHPGITGRKQTSRRWDPGLPACSWPRPRPAGTASRHRSLCPPHQVAEATPGRKLEQTIVRPRSLQHMDNSQKVEGPHVSSTGERINNVRHMRTMEHFPSSKGTNLCRRYGMDAPGGHCTKGNEPVTKGRAPHDPTSMG